MKMLKKWGLVGLLASVASASAWAQFPEKPVKLLVAFPAGGVPDTMARAYAEKLKDIWAQPIIVESKPGATGGLGAETLVRSPADGYHQMLNANGLLINQLTSKQRFDVFKDLVPVIRPAQTPYLFIVSHKLPVRNFQEFIAHAKANPGKLTCATYGIASPPHIALELLKKEAGVNVEHISYNTTLPYADLNSGTLDCAVVPPSGTLLQYVQTGITRAIANSGDGVIGEYVNAESVTKRYPKARLVGWQAIFVPASIKPELLQKIQKDWMQAMKDPVVIRRIREAGFEPLEDTPEAFKKAMHDEYAIYSEVIKTIDLKK